MWAIPGAYSHIQGAHLQWVVARAWVHVECVCECVCVCGWVCLGECMFCSAPDSLNRINCFSTKGICVKIRPKKKAKEKTRRVRYNKRWIFSRSWRNSDTLKKIKFRYKDKKKLYIKATRVELKNLTANEFINRLIGYRVILFPSATYLPYACSTKRFRRMAKVLP